MQLMMLRCAYPKMDIENLLVAIRQGNTASRIVFCRLRNLSQARKQHHNTIDTMSRVSTTALRQEYSVPPSSKADTRRTELARRSKAPRKSILPKLRERHRCDRSEAVGGCGKLLGKAIRISPTAKAPTGALDFDQHRLL